MATAVESALARHAWTFHTWRADVLTRRCPGPDRYDPVAGRPFRYGDLRARIRRQKKLDADGPYPETITLSAQCHTRVSAGH
ncbi:hypothetical protein [Streptomyces sp. NPDC004546]|uniref:hypothetical protein n=1 Tax=unclassified Streptomyces TaxID=2593676 RepID=UPI0033B12963